MSDSVCSSDRAYSKRRTSTNQSTSPSLSSSTQSLNRRHHSQQQNKSHKKITHKSTNRSQTSSTRVNETVKLMKEEKTEINVSLYFILLKYVENEVGGVCMCVCCIVCTKFYIRLLKRKEKYKRRKINEKL